jgi:hypothetical protein
MVHSSYSVSSESQESVQNPRDTVMTVTYEGKVKSSHPN